MSNFIDTLIDGKASYAYAFMTRDRNYGHMTVNIRMAAPEYGWRKNGVIKISCQIGSDGTYDRQSEEPYAISYGLSSQYDSIQLEELEAGVKLMRKIGRHMDKMCLENGEPDGYADFCQRVLVGSGVSAMIVEPGQGWANGGLMRDKQLLLVGAASRKKLVEMENALIGAFSRKVA